MQTRLELKMEKILAIRDNSELPLPYGGLHFRKSLWERLSLLPESLDELEEIVLLAKGPMALFLRARFEVSKASNTNLQQSTRLSGNKVRLLWDNSLKVKAINRLVDLTKIKPVSFPRNIVGKGFVIINYNKPRPNINR